MLARVAAGEEVTITKHGRFVALMIGVAGREDDRPRDAVEALRTLRKTTILGGADWKRLRDERRPWPWSCSTPRSPWPRLPPVSTAHV